LLHRTGREKPIRVGVTARTALDRAALMGIVSGAEGLVATDLGDGGTLSQDRAAQLTPQVIVVDLDRRAASSFAAALRAREPGIQILALLRTGAVEDVLALARVGIVGFLSPDTGTRDLLRGIRRLLVTGCAVSSELVVPLLGAVRAQVTGWHTPGSVILHLTSREAQVVGCVAHGLTDKEIARALHIGRGTVKTHIHRLLRKLGGSRRSDVVERVREMDHKLSLLAAAYGPAEASTQGRAASELGAE